MNTCVTVVLLLLLVQTVVCQPFWKVLCSGRPLFRGRADPIISPGLVSGHVHKVAGGSNFGVALANQTALEVYNNLKASPCTTCSLRPVDNSAYWHPDLFYRWPNGSYSLVPTGGLTVYYLHRSGDGTQANPAWTAFPKGFRMVSGNPFRRSYNASSVADQAISFACLSDTANPETPYLPTATKFCKNGLRMQVHFPQCWDGKNLDSPTHTTHVAFPTRPDGGNCPSTHPVRLTDLFFEAFYSVADFPHGTGTQPFVLACGDSTGYGFHGDFLNGWDVTVLQNAINDPSCDISRTNGDAQYCNTLKPYIFNTDAGNCSISKDIPINENIGFVATTALPGCNPVTGEGPNATPCATAPPSATWQASTTSSTTAARFLLKSVQTGKYVRAGARVDILLRANSLSTTYWEAYTTSPFAGGYVSIFNEATMQYLSPSADNYGVCASRGSVDTWEQYQIISQGNGQYAIKARRNGNYLTVMADFSITASSTTVGNAQLFQLVTPPGGGV